jgi:type II secretory ATPase GspE/PulE/Tfp pilus assembly ATPase PilB-like protein
MKVLKRSQVLLIFLFLLVYTWSVADRIYKKDGSVLEGKIIFRSQEKLILETGPSLVKVEINIQDVDKVEEGVPESLPESHRPLYLAGERALQEGKPVEALESFLNLLDDFDQPPQFLFLSLTAALTQSISQSDTNAENSENRSLAIHQYERLRAISFREGFGKFVKISPQWKDLEGQLNEKLSRIYYLKAVDDSKKNDPSLLSSIEKNLNNALSLTPKSHPRHYQILESLGLFQMNYNNKMDESISLFQKGYEEATDNTIKQRFYGLMVQARNTKIEKTKGPGKVIPSPTPYTAKDIEQLNVAPGDSMAPSSQKQKSPKAPPLYKQLLLHWKNQKYKEAGQLLWNRVGQTRILPTLALVAAFIVVFWIIPVAIIRWRSRRVDLIAGKMLVWVKFTGLIGLLVYVILSIFHFIFKKRAPRELCPYCKKRIDTIEVYKDYNFRICPHCHENIVPVYSLESYILHLVENVQSTMNQRAGYSFSKNIIEKDAMLKLIRGIITLAFRKRASDVHIEPENEGLKIRSRIDGMLYEILSLPKQIADPIVSAIKVMANMDISEKRVPQDGRISLWIDKRDLDLRISTSPVSNGEKASIRLLDPRDIQSDSTRLGLDGENLEKFERIIRKPYGLILVTGPSGSGKSTTLYVALHTLNTGDKNIVTIEDPVEYKLEGISQQQVHVEANFTFATGLRSILRQDPDVIMVGEIRDKETADIAIDAATTGHMVLTTLHTTDAPTAFGRLTDLGISIRRYAPILLAIVAQRLIRLNCPECKKPYKPDKSCLDMLELDEKTQIVYKKGPGCQNCNNTGFYGRTGIFEILMPDDETKTLLESNPAVSVIRELARNKGMRTLREEGILKISMGLTTVEEVLRVTT